MGDIDTTKVRRCSLLLEPPAPGVVVELCDEIDTIRARVAELEVSVAVEAANGKHWAAAYSKWVQTDEAAKKLIEQEERIADLESALAKSGSREAALVEKLKVAEEALLSGARSAEALKRPCGMDPETPQAIRNGEYMSISLNLRAALSKIKEAP